MTENTPTPAELISEAELVQRDLRVNTLGERLEVVDKLISMARQLTAARDALAAILVEAPHGPVCGAYADPFWPDPTKCNCWKSKLPADALAARDADKWDEGREAESEAHFRDAGYGDVQHPVNPYRIDREARA